MVWCGRPHGLCSNGWRRHFAELPLVSREHHGGGMSAAEATVGCLVLHTAHYVIRCGVPPRAACWPAPRVETREGSWMHLFKQLDLLLSRLFMWLCSVSSELVVGIPITMPHKYQRATPTSAVRRQHLTVLPGCREILHLYCLQSHIQLQALNAQARPQRRGHTYAIM